MCVAEYHCDFIFVGVCQADPNNLVLSPHFACLSPCVFQRKTFADNTLP